MPDRVLFARAESASLAYDFQPMNCCTSYLIAKTLPLVAPFESLIHANPILAERGLINQQKIEFSSRNEDITHRDGSGKARDNIARSFFPNSQTWLSLRLPSSNLAEETTTS